MGHLPAQPEARREPAEHSHRAPATAMNVVLQVLPHPAPETGQIRIVAEVGSRALPWGGAAVGGGERPTIQALEADSNSATPRGVETEAEE